jgi:hypothetical protein
MAAYGFANVMAAIAGPNGNFDFGFGSGNSEGGISVVYVEDKNTMTIGADGSVMHSLHSGKAAIVTVRLLKTSPTNSQFETMYNLDVAGGIGHGQNTITVRDMARGDIVTCQQVAFAKFADVTYAKDGGEMVWTFHSGVTDSDLGAGIVAAA